MEYVNCLVAIGGDAGNTVPKFNLPVSEIPVLQAIHGADAVFDFEPVDPPEEAEEFSNREELRRLQSVYGHVTDRDGNKILQSIYSGAGARVVTDIEDLELPEGAFKAVERASAKAEPKATAKPKAASTTKAKAGKAKADADASKDADNGGAKGDDVDAQANQILE